MLWKRGTERRNKSTITATELPYKEFLSLSAPTPKSVRECEEYLFVL